MPYAVAILPGQLLLMLMQALSGRLPSLALQAELQP
jgi:hypothetical protein